MLSPDDCCVKSVDVTQQVKTCGTSEIPSTKFQDTINIGEELMKHHCEPASIPVHPRSSGDDCSKSKCSRLERTENKSGKLTCFSKQQRKNFSKRKLISTFYRSGNKIMERKSKKLYRQSALSYIQVLQSTVKKQKNVIRYLKLKLKKVELNAETVRTKNSKPEREIPLSNKFESLTSQKGVNVASDLQSQKSESKIDSNFQELLCENMEVTENNSDIHSRLNSCNNERLSKDGGNSIIPTRSSDQLMYSDEINFIENNLEVEMIESESRVHLHSDQLNSKNVETDEVDEEVKKHVEEFMCREDISVVDLNVKHLKQSEKVTRFRRHFLGVLYKQFHGEVNSKCNYSQFIKYIPQNVIKPSPTYWKILMCQRCENAELKFMEVVNKVLLRKDILLEEVLAKQELYEHVSQQLGKLRNSQKPFTYMTWAKTLLGKMEANGRIVTTTIGSACTDLLKELDLLKEHINRCYNQYEAVMEAREETEISPIHAIVHIDWYESPATFVARHLHTSYYYGDGFKTLHAGFVRTKAKSFGFASLSDCRDHTAPAVWASINDILVSLAKEGMKVITIVSDSATAQYRNKGNFYLMRRFAKQNNVEMKWIYLEGGHGKGIADAIGAAIKQIMCDTIAHHPNKSFRNTMDILPIIKDLTPIKLFTHTDYLVQQYKNLLSRQHLQVIPSTYKIHEVCVKETSFYVKESSADKLPFYSLDTLLKRNWV